MRGRWGVWAAALVGATLALATTIVAPASATEEAGPLAEQTLLRLSELPGGYVVKGGGYCEPLEVHSYTGKRALEAWAKTFSPFDCHLGYKRLYRPAGAAATPPIVATASVTTSSVEAARAAKSVMSELVENLTEARNAHSAPTPSAIGDETHVFRSPEFDDYRVESLPGVTVVWRVGAAVEVAYAGGWSYAKDERAAYALAAKQQAQVLAPTPYLASEADDIPTYFENPGLKLPTYWLGKTFAPGKGLEPSYFDSVATGAELGGRNSPDLGQVVEYAPALFLDSWSPRAWARFAKDPVGRQPWAWHCTRSREIRIPDGQATIYAAYRKDYATCPGYAPRHSSAEVHLPGVVITIGVETCAFCGSPTLSYGSLDGMEAVVRGLRPWEPGDDS